MGDIKPMEFGAPLFFLSLLYYEGLMSSFSGSWIKRKVTYFLLSDTNCALFLLPPVQQLLLVELVGFLLAPVGVHDRSTHHSLFG